jgi:hypothetical protein
VHVAKLTADSLDFGRICGNLCSTVGGFLSSYENEEIVVLSSKKHDHERKSGKGKNQRNNPANPL